MRQEAYSPIQVTEGLEAERLHYAELAESIRLRKDKLQAERAEQEKRVREAMALNEKLAELEARRARFAQLNLDKPVMEERERKLAEAEKAGRIAAYDEEQAERAEREIAARQAALSGKRPSCPRGAGARCRLGAARREQARETVRPRRSKRCSGWKRWSRPSGRWRPPPGGRAAGRGGKPRESRRRNGRPPIGGHAAGEGGARGRDPVARGGAGRAAGEAGRAGPHPPEVQAAEGACGSGRADRGRAQGGSGPGAGARECGERVKRLETLWLEGQAGLLAAHCTTGSLARYAAARSIRRRRRRQPRCRPAKSFGRRRKRFAP
ncbi:hypothetical protein [Cohnella algarum]|uniref:hypothetical protein n=1 Tax=Cohnella algarum TaxID=2044859 RepID=UPI001F07FFEE|nr:hypothetical protein [Cohnella algarum]